MMPTNMRMIATTQAKIGLSMKNRDIYRPAAGSLAGVSAGAAACSSGLTSMPALTF